ncbi:MAG: AAA family ATPase [Bacteroidota bacterium]
MAIDLSTLPLRMRLLIEQLSNHLFEKEQVIRITLLSALAGESIFLLGPPGVAKSMVARRIKFAFQGAKSFEYLMGKFSTPDEVFGPVSISRLKNEDKYERLVDNYLPGAQIVFLDEIWKASPAIQNSLLTVLNEKVFRNGDQEMKVDLRGLIAASNELPPAGEGLDALWDRFLVRLSIHNIQDPETFNQMLLTPSEKITQNHVEDKLKISQEEYQELLDLQKDVQISRHILGLIQHIKRSIQERNATFRLEEQIYISDRRWRKIAALMRAAALLNGRWEVHVMDCFLIADCIWQTPEQIEEMRELVKGSISSYGFMGLARLRSIQQDMEELRKEIELSTRIAKKITVQRVKIYEDQKGLSYVHILDFWSENNAYVKLQDIENMGEDQDAFIGVYERSAKTFRAFQRYGFRKKNRFTLFSNGKPIPLETEAVEEERIELKQPNEDQQSRWNRRIQVLLESLDKDLKKLEAQRSEEMQHVAQNLFVPASMGPIIHQSIKQTIDEVLNLRLEIEKTQDSYVSLRAN